MDYTVTTDPETGEEVARWRPATETDVIATLLFDDNPDDGRSGPMWIRLSDGTLILGIFPRGDRYEAVTQAISF